MNRSKTRTCVRTSTALACWLIAVAHASSGADPAGSVNPTVSYVAYRFEAGEGWRTSASGDAGATRLEGRLWHHDFTRGASSIGLTLPDRSLLTRPERLRLRVRGAAQGHPLRVPLQVGSPVYVLAVLP